MAKAVSKNELRLLALIAYRAGEISEGRCCELAGLSRNDIRDEMHKRCGKYQPYDEACREAEEWKRKYEELCETVKAFYDRV